MIESCSFCQDVTTLGPKLSFEVTYPEDDIHQEEQSSFISFVYRFDDGCPRNVVYKRWEHLFIVGHSGEEEIICAVEKVYTLTVSDSFQPN